MQDASEFAVTTSSAVAIQFSATYELTLYFAILLRYGEVFATTQLWLSMLERVRLGTVAFADAVATVDPESIDGMDMTV